MERRRVIHRVKSWGCLSCSGLTRRVEVSLTQDVSPEGTLETASRQEATMDGGHPAKRCCPVAPYIHSGLMKESAAGLEAAWSQ